MDTKTLRCGLLGRKLGHSYSPAIHERLADYSYRLFEVEPEDLGAFLQEGAFDGLNVTIPYKKDVIPYCAELSDTARAIGAVNTLVRRADGTLWGDNTDTYVFSMLVQSSGADVAGKKALVFGGDTMTATDIAVRLGMVELGDKSKVADIPQETADKAMAVIRALVEDSVDAMKVSNADVDLILVGGGSIILPETIGGAASVLKPEHFGCANAIGSAISKVSGMYEKLMNYDELPREQSLEKAKKEAIELAVAAGAVRKTVEIIEMEDVPLAYYPGNTNRVKIKAAGDLS